MFSGRDALGRGRREGEKGAGGGGGEGGTWRVHRGE